MSVFWPGFGRELARLHEYGRIREQLVTRKRCSLAQLTYKQFIRYLRSALHYLYDPDQLRRSPLAPLFGVAERFDTPSALQRILTEAIEALKPSDDEPAQSRAWRIYDALVYRYVRRFDREAVADQLGISGRQLRREQLAALEMLAQHLWEEYGLHASESVAATAPSSGPVAPSDELAWLKDVPPGRPTDLKPLLEAVLELARPLARQWSVALHSDLADTLPHLAVPPVALRHALLNLLTVAIPRVPGGEVRLSAQPVEGHVELRVQCEGLAMRDSSLPVLPTSESEQAGLNMARQLADLCGARLDLGSPGALAVLTVPVLERIPVLVVDDNADALQLFERYAAGTRYTVAGTREPEQAITLARELSPRVIVLDVMMPEVDGWELLVRLRQHPLTGTVPIVICSILPQGALARPLGADAFLQKPVTREAFLRVLDEQVR